MPENQHTPLWRQLLGAATGSVVALLLYGGFVAVSPNLSVLTAYLSSTFEGNIEHLPTYQCSPRTIREEALAQRGVLGDRARAATARLQNGENYFQKSSSSFSSSSSSSVATVPLVAKNQQKEETSPKKATASHLPKKQDKHRSEQKADKANLKQKKEKLPDTGVPLWAIGSVALCLAMSIRYRRELLGHRLP